jgi:hypothetical protein
LFQFEKKINVIKNQILYFTGFKEFANSKTSNFKKHKKEKK